MTVKLISITPRAEYLIAYLARVSSPNQENTEFEGLIKYLIRHQHWSPFELCHAVLEIQTSRAISAQIIRHRSFSFSEFSQRYSDDIDSPPLVDGRKQSEKNRQSSADPLNKAEQLEWYTVQNNAYDAALGAYEKALQLGVAREQARMLLPLGTPTRLYMAGSIRSWIHWVNLRSLEDTQIEHRQLAVTAREILSKELPIIAKALNWIE